jgi:predicted Zn finger-like uncharacterized protein
MIDFKCPHCGNEMHVKDESVGLKGKCKKCGNTVAVPAVSEALAEPDIDDFLEVAEVATPVPAVRSQRTAQLSSASSAKPSAASSPPTRQAAAAIDWKFSELPKNERTAIRAGVGGLALLALATCLPWFSVTTLMRFTAWGIGGPDGELVFVLSIAAAAGVVIAHHRKKYWFESLLAASAWGTICFFWMGLLVFRALSAGSTFGLFKISVGIGLYLALLAGPLTAAAFSYVAARQTPTFQPAKRKLLLIGAHGGGVVVAWLLGIIVSQRIAVSMTPTIEMTNMPTPSGTGTLPPGTIEFRQTPTETSGTVTYPPGTMPKFSNGMPFQPGSMPNFPKGMPFPPGSMPKFPNVPRAASGAPNAATPNAAAEEPGQAASNDAPTNDTPANPASPSAVPATPNDQPVSPGRPPRSRRRSGRSGGGNKVAGGSNLTPGAESADAVPSTPPADDSQPAPREARPAVPLAETLAARARASKEAEVARLEEKKADSDQARQLLQQFQIVQAGARIEKRSRKGAPQWVRVVVVKNGTGFVIGHAHFKGTVLAPGNDTPLLTDTFNHKVKCGLAPGEQAEWKITPKGNAWKALNENAEMTYNVEVVRLDGTDGKPLVKDDFKAEDQLRLDRLKKDLAETK